MFDFEYLPVEEIEFDPQMHTQVINEPLSGVGLGFEERCKRLRPIRVRRDGDRYVLIDGEQRLLRARHLMLTKINAIIEQPPRDDIFELRHQLVETFDNDLPPCEKARCIQQLVEVAELPLAKAAERLAMSKSLAYKLLALLSLPEDIRKGVDNGSISASAGCILSRVKKPGKQAALARKVAAGHLTRDELASAVKSERNGEAEREAVPWKRVKAVVNGRCVTVAGGSR